MEIERRGGGGVQGESWGRPTDREKAVGGLLACFSTGVKVSGGIAVDDEVVSHVLFVPTLLMTRSGPDTIVYNGLYLASTSLAGHDTKL